MPVIMFMNLKGGVAKTTNAVAVAECLAAAGHRTLLIDSDHQCMSGELLLGEDRQLRLERSRRTLHDLLAEMLDDEFKASQFDAFVAGNASNIGGGLPKLAVLPCSIRIDDFSTNMAKARRGYNSTEEFLRLWEGRKRLVRRWLDANYDFTVIDCPPSMAVQVRFLLSVSDHFVVPSVPDRLSVRGSCHLADRIKGSGYKVHGLGTLWSLYREQNAMHKRIVDMAARGDDPFGRLPPPFETVVPNAARIGEASEPGGRPASFRVKYTHAFAKLYENLCEEIVQRAEWQVRRPDAGRVILQPAVGV